MCQRFGFDVVEMPWRKKTFLNDRTFLLNIIQSAENKNDKMNYIILLENQAIYESYIFLRHKLLVNSLLEIDEKTTLKSWTIMETIIGITGLVCASPL